MTAKSAIARARDSANAAKHVGTSSDLEDTCDPALIPHLVAAVEQLADAVLLLCDELEGGTGQEAPPMTERQSPVTREEYEAASAVVVSFGKNKGMQVGHLAYGPQLDWYAACFTEDVATAAQTVRRWIDEESARIGVPPPGYDENDWGGP